MSTFTSRSCNVDGLLSVLPSVYYKIPLFSGLLSLFGSSVLFPYATCLNTDNTYVKKFIA